MTKYYRRGAREYYMIGPEKVIRLINKEYRSDVTIIERQGGGAMVEMASGFLEYAALDGVEISREEFAKEFEVASRLIVLEP